MLTSLLVSSFGLNIFLMCLVLQIVSTIGGCRMTTSLKFIGLVSIGLFFGGLFAFVVSFFIYLLT